ncbi:MAG: indole-3-glycerol phosphate synthase TrpC [Armatimonadota bacterium]|nr:indole-3-glycerol phosphate synthase TrpC [Armatimonadota bacterium]
MILDEITQFKRAEVDRQKEAVPPAEVKAALADAPAIRDFAGAVRRTGSGMRIIAEAKKASPSKGVIREDFRPVEIARAFEANGASAISVLTDQKFFQGALSYLTDVKSAVGLPILRKDFIIDEYQIYQSRAAGADAILLIAAILPEGVLRSFLDTAGGLGLSCLVEVHDEPEMETALAVGAKVIGVNNRDLRTFQVDINTTARLARMAPCDRVIVSESGVHSRADVDFLSRVGTHAILVGESLMRAEDIGAKLRELIG